MDVTQTPVKHQHAWVIKGLYGIGLRGEIAICVLYMTFKLAWDFPSVQPNPEL